MPARNNNRKQTLKRVVGYVAEFPVSFIFSILFAILSVAATLYIPLLTGDAVDCIVGPGEVDYQTLFSILIRIAVSAFVVFISQYLMGRCNNRLAYRTAFAMRQEAFSHLHKLPVGYFDSHSRGDTVSRIISDTDQLTDGLLLGFSQLFSGVMTIIGTLFFLFSVSWVLALVVVLITPLSLFVSAFIAKRTHTLFARQSVLRGQQTAYTEEFITGSSEVKVFGHKDECQEEFEKLNQTWAETSLKATFFSSITNPATRFVNAVVYAIVALCGALSAVRGMISVGSLTSALSYATQYTKPFNEISGVVTELQNAIACADRVFELIDEAEESEDGKISLEKASGEVCFEDISFSYNKDKKLIEHFTFTARPGEHVAIVGPTGSGKTTLINLLMRFYDTDKGVIRIDGKDIRDYSRHSLRSSFGMVLQDTYLISGTVRDNIALYRKASDEEVVKAAEKAHADAFIRRLPQGYDTYLDDDTASLSAGERQLLCIARIMLSLPDMLILDEATSSIDTRTEELIQNSFSALMQGRTSFVVAHRLSTIENADMILVLKDGQVIEMGSHKELLEAKGFYADLFQSQFAI